jgi:hypothetical protein
VTRPAERYTAERYEAQRRKGARVSSGAEVTHPFARGDEYPYRVEFSTAHGLIRGWMWATSVRRAKERLEDELGGAAFTLHSIRVDPSGYAPHPHEHVHSRGSKHFVRDLSASR